MNNFFIYYTMENYKVVGNEQLIKDFFKDFGLFDLKLNESWLIQTSFRTKKLTDTERDLFRSHPKNCFKTKALKTNKQGIFDAEESITRLYEFELPVRSCTYNSASYPQSAPVTYINVNKTNETEVAMKHMQEIVDIINKNALINDYEQFKSLLAKTNRDWCSERATCIVSNSVNFDIDFENITGYEAWKTYSEEIISFVKNLFGKDTIVIICNGGFHIVTPKTYIKENPKNICDKIKDNLQNIQIKEIEYKGPKSFIPLPGTYQYGSDDNHIVQYVKI